MLTDLSRKEMNHGQTEGGQDCRSMFRQTSTSTCVSTNYTVLYMLCMKQCPEIFLFIHGHTLCFSQYNMVMLNRGRMLHICN